MSVLREPEFILQCSELLEHMASTLSIAEGASEAASWIDWIIDQVIERWPKRQHGGYKDAEFTKHLLDNLQAHIDNLRKSTDCGSWRDEMDKPAPPAPGDPFASLFSGEKPDA